jgi:hypothetical protein
MIRNVVIGRLRKPESPEQEAADRKLLQEGLDGMAALDLPGQLAMTVGVDLALRDGNWSFAITNDWADADAYAGYDADEEHNRLRREVFAVVSETVSRAQIEI